MIPSYIPIVAIAAPKTISNSPKLSALHAFQRHLPLTFPLTTWTFHCAPDAGWALLTTSDVPPLVHPPPRNALLCISAAEISIEITASVFQTYLIDLRMWSIKPRRDIFILA